MGVPDKERRKLFLRSGNRCAFPKCGRPLTADETADDPLVAIGEIAHIVAESPAGPRGASSLTPAERDRYENLVLLCPTHHALVDAQAETYPVAWLHRVKREHEAWVEARLEPATPARAALTVFVSSPYRDNRRRRAVVFDAILAAGMLPVGMERFTASPHPTVEECLRQARECDGFVGVVAWRYGWIPPGHDVSICELEYDAAKEAGRARFVFVPDPSAGMNPDTDCDPLPDRWERQARLEAFKARLASDLTPCVFQDDVLGIRVLQALTDWRQKRAAARDGGRATPGPAPPTDRPPDLAAEIAAYGRKADAFHGTLPMAGFKTRLRVPIDLADLYVPLRARVDLRATGPHERYADAADAEKRLGDGDGSHEIALAEAFREAARRGGSRGLVLLGDPGSGKTTHAKRVLLACLRDGPESLGLPAGTLPVFLPLRELQDLHQGLPEFIQAQLEQPHLGTPPGFGARLVERGNLLLLLDGLDEVPDVRRRAEVARWVDAALTAHRECRFVVTCRFAGWAPEVARWISGKFLELHVRPLTDAQAEQFVRGWYRIVETGLADDRAQAEVLARKGADDLLGRLAEPDFRARRVSELTRNPLLLANLCLVHRDRGGQLPQRRAKLYDECVDVLLERWREAKRIPLSVTADQGRRVLQPAALWLHAEEGRTRATAEALAPPMADALAAVGWARTGEDFLATVRDESGLLTGWDDRHYGFLHLGFQEYLAAQEIRRRALLRDEGPLRELAARLGESWWQEVGLLLLALGNPSLFEPFVREALKHPTFAAHPDLLELCLDDAAEVSAVPFRELVEAPPGRDRGLWARQLVALRVLERLDPTALAALERPLRKHPSAELQAWLRARGAAARQDTVVAERGGYELVRIPAGTFTMGSPETEEGHYGDEGPQHRVTIPAFFLGRAPVTNEEYARYLEAKPGVRKPSWWEDRKFNQPRQPVVGVSWDEAQGYCAWAGLRLPSEAEWEYACRAGTTTRFWSGDGEADLERVAWYDKNSDRRPHSVGEKPANPFGLFDMHGNVWEWCEDDWHETYEGAPTDERAWVDDPRDSRRVLRGGSFGFVAGALRAACRRRVEAGVRVDQFGFRCVRVPAASMEP